MRWTADLAGAVHTLEDKGARLAFVSLRETKGAKNRWRVKTCVSFLYFGAVRQRRLERSRKQWVVTTRRFADRGVAEAYVAGKRTEVERFITGRESGR